MFHICESAQHKNTSKGITLISVPEEVCGSAELPFLRSSTKSRRDKEQPRAAAPSRAEVRGAARVI